MFNRILSRRPLSKETAKGKHRFPRVTRIDAFVPGGCLFNVTNYTEQYRVEAFGDEEEFTRMILDAVKPGELFFDVGSSIGFVAVQAAKKGCRVAAFEPDPSYRNRLRENVELNQLDNVQIIDWAVSDGAGTSSLWTNGLDGASPSLSKVGSRECVEVRTDSIDRAIARNELSAPDVIKVDVEGAETGALRGMANLLASARRPRIVFIELHPTFLPTFGSSVEEAHGLLVAVGYQVTYDRSRADQIHRVYSAR